MRYWVYHLGLQVACGALRPKPLVYHLGLQVACGALRPKPLVYHLGLQVACGALRPKPLLVIAALLAFGCNKNHDETRPSAKSLTDPSSITDFSSLDATAWVNGAPVSLAEARGKNVVLIEAWHPA